jgi:hypothetical protein
MDNKTAKSQQPLNKKTHPQENGGFTAEAALWANCNAQRRERGSFATKATINRRQGT